jgi:hypothetical protein
MFVIKYSFLCDITCVWHDIVCSVTSVLTQQNRCFISYLLYYYKLYFGVLTSFFSCVASTFFRSYLPLRGFAITLMGHTTLGGTPLNGWSARRKDIYLITHNTYKRRTSRSPAGFEPRITSNEWPQTHPLDYAATGSAFSLCFSKSYGHHRGSDIVM